MSELTITIGRKQMDTLERLVALQMLGHSVSGCARLLNVSRETIYQWMKNPLYSAMKTRERSEFQIATTDAIIGAQLDAVRMLQDLVTDFRIPKVDRVEAAQYLMQLGIAPEHKPTPDDESLAKHVFPEVVSDEPVNELPATTQPIGELESASTVRFEDHFNSLHYIPAPERGE